MKITETEAKANLELLTIKWEVDEETSSDSMNIIIDQKFIDSLYTAIQALKEIQQYRKIGTVKECQAMMEKNEQK